MKSATVHWKSSVNNNVTFSALLPRCLSIMIRWFRLQQVSVWVNIRKQPSVAVLFSAQLVTAATQSLSLSLLFIEAYAWAGRIKRDLVWIRTYVHHNNRSQVGLSTRHRVSPAPSLGCLIFSAPLTWTPLVQIWHKRLFHIKKELIRIWRSRSRQRAKIHITTTA